MTGFNLPPGCRVSDIPGNRPEDLAAIAVIEKIDALLSEAMHEGVLTRLDVVEALRQMVEDYDIGR